MNQIIKINASFGHRPFEALIQAQEPTRIKPSNQIQAGHHNVHFKSWDWKISKKSSKTHSKSYPYGVNIYIYIYIYI